MQDLLKIHEKDNVATCLCSIATGTALSVDSITLTANEVIPQYHKIALQDIPLHEAVYKYGQVIGLATMPIKKGEHVHIHNVESTRGRGDKKGE